MGARFSVAASAAIPVLFLRSVAAAGVGAICDLEVLFVGVRLHRLLACPDNVDVDARSFVHVRGCTGSCFSSSARSLRFSLTTQRTLSHSSDSAAGTPDSRLA